MPTNPDDYKKAAYNVNKPNEFSAETKRVRRDLDDFGTSFRNLEKSLYSLIGGVKSADKTFTDVARRGRIMGTEALSGYSVAHNVIDKLFTTSAAKWTHGFEAVQHHAQGAGSQLLSFFGQISRLEESKRRITEDYEEHFTTQKQLQEEILWTEREGNKEKALSLRQCHSELEKTIALVNWEEKWLKFSKAALPLAVLWGETVGRVLAHSFELQRNFRDVNLDFTRSVDLTQTLLTAIGRSQGLVTLKEAAETFRSLRAYSREFLTRDIIARVATFQELTGVSAESVAKIAYQLKTFGGEMPNINRLTNSFTYFARETDLGAGGVMELLSAMDPLITSYPTGMKEKLVPQILAMGDAFKEAGLNATEMLKTIEEMRDITSKAGRMNLALTSMAGISPRDVMFGTADPAQIAMAITRSRRRLMQQFKAGGLNPETSASILSARFGGTIEEWKRAGGLSDIQVARMESRMAEDQRRAKELDNFQKALDALASGPVAKLSTLLSSINVAFLKAGTNIINMINGIVGGIKKIPGVSGALHRFFLFFTDEKRGGFQWGVQFLTKSIVILTPVLGIGLLKAIGGLWKASWQLIGTLGKVATTMDLVSEASNLLIKNQEKNTLQQTALAGAEALEMKAAAGAGKGGFWKKLFGLGGGAAAIGAGGGLFSWVGKLFGKGAAKEEAELGAEVGTKGLFKMLGETGAKAMGKLGKLIPGVGGAIGMIWALWDIIQILRDPKESAQNKVIKSVIKFIGGLLSFIPYVGIGLQAAMDLWADSIGKNTDELKKQNENLEDANKPKPTKAPSTGAGAPPPPSGDIYSKGGYGGGGGGGGRYPRAKGRYPTDTTPTAEGYRILEEYPWEGPSSNWHGGRRIQHGEVGLGHELENKYGIRQGDWVLTSKHGWRNVQESSNSAYGIEYHASHVGEFDSAGREKILAIRHGRSGRTIQVNEIMGVTGGKPSASPAPGAAPTAPPAAPPPSKPTESTAASGNLSDMVAYGGSLIKRPPLPPGLHWEQGGTEPYHNLVLDEQDRTVEGAPLKAIFKDYYAHKTRGKTSMLGNEAVQDHLENLIQKEGRRGRVALRTRGPEMRETAFMHARRAEELATDKHGQAMLAELQTSNRMNKERLYYLRQQRFLGPTLLPRPDEDLSIGGLV